MNKPKPKFTDEELKILHELLGTMEYRMLVYMFGEKSEEMRTGSIYCKLDRYFNEET